VDRQPGAPVHAALDAFPRLGAAPDAVLRREERDQLDLGVIGQQVDRGRAAAPASSPTTSSATSSSATTIPKKACKPSSTNCAPTTPTLRSVSL